MKRIKTLRVRFALWIAGLLLVVLAAFGTLVYASLRQGLLASIDDSLRLSGSQAIAAVNIENGRIDFSDSIPEGSAAAELRERGLTIRVLSASGQIIQAFGPYRAMPVSAESFSAAQRDESTFATLTDPTQADSVRFYSVPILENGLFFGVVQVAQTLGGVQQTLDRLLAALLLSLPPLICVAGFGGYVLARRALTPIDQITRTARRISAEDLSARLNVLRTDDEVGHLATTFDDMLARLDESFRRERQFVADASHELRTPLAAMQAILSVVREERRTPEDYEQALADISEEAHRLRGLVEDLLLLARGDTRQLAIRAKVDLSSLLRDVTDSLRPLAEAKRLTLDYHAAGGLTVMGDSDGLIRLFVNLLDNAVKYTEQGSVAVMADAETADHSLRVTIADTGIGIPPEHLPHIFDRFYRVDKSRTSRGLGLGLAIALDMARAHGGTIEASSTVGTGTTFIVRLPE